MSTIVGSILIFDTTLTLLLIIGTVVSFGGNWLCGCMAIALAYDGLCGCMGIALAYDVCTCSKAYGAIHICTRVLMHVMHPGFAAFTITKMRSMAALAIRNNTIMEPDEAIALAAAEDEDAASQGGYGSQSLAEGQVEYDPGLYRHA